MAPLSLHSGITTQDSLFCRLTNHSNVASYGHMGVLYNSRHYLFITC